MLLKAQNGFCTNETAALKEMLFMDAVRGEDSTGVAALYNNGELEMAKDATPSWEFINSKEFSTLSSRLVSRGKAVMGHNRKKTIGKIDETTAHPFILDNRFAFMHNGTLHSHKHLADTEVDSEALGIHLTKCNGNPKLIEEALATVYGAYACVWIDVEEDRMYMLRNAERPLVLAETDAGYVFASEYGIIAAACLRNRIKVKEVDSIKEHTLYTFDLSKHGVTYTEDTLVVKKATPPSTTPATLGGHTKVYANGGVSKNAYKRFRKFKIGTRISFWLDDFVERHYPDVDGDWLVFGKSDEVDASHIIRGYLNGVTKDALEIDHQNYLHSGLVEDAEVDPKTKMLVVTLIDIKQSPRSYTSKTTWPYPANIMN